jgi:transcriptional regulator with XRE-family HTH domain
MTTFTAMAIADEIKRVRKEQRYSQRQLAEICGFKQQELSLYEKGKVTPTLERLETIAKALGKEWKLK